MVKIIHIPREIKEVLDGFGPLDKVCSDILRTTYEYNLFDIFKCPLIYNRSDCTKYTISISDDAQYIFSEGAFSLSRVIIFFVSNACYEDVGWVSKPTPNNSRVIDKYYSIAKHALTELSLNDTKNRCIVTELLKNLEDIYEK